MKKQVAEYTREFTAYANAQGRSPEQQLALDRTEYPGGVMAGFMIWMSGALKAFSAKHPECLAGDRIANQDAKCKFLEGLSIL